MKVPFLDLKRSHDEIHNELELAFKRVLDSGKYVLGDEVSSFETEFITQRHLIYNQHMTNCIFLKGDFLLQKNFKTRYLVFPCTLNCKTGNLKLLLIPAYAKLNYEPD